MKRVMKRCLMSIAVILLMLIYTAPAARAEGAPNFAKRQSNVYHGKSYDYTVKNVPKGGSVEWSVTGPGERFIELSRTTGNTNKITVNTSGASSAKNAQAKVQAVVRDNSKKRVKTVGDAVTIKITATAVSINAPKGADVKKLVLGTSYKFRRELTPSNATSTVYYRLEGAEGAATTGGSIDERGNAVFNYPGTYNIVAEAKNAEDGEVLASAALKVVAGYELGEVYIGLKEGGGVPSGIFVDDTISLALFQEVRGVSLRTRVLTDEEKEALIQYGVIDRSQADKQVYVFEIEGELPKEGVQFSTKDMQFEKIIGNAEASFAAWNGSTGKCPYEFTGNVDIGALIKGYPADWQPNPQRYFLAMGSSEKEPGNISFKTGVEAEALKTSVTGWNSANGYASVDTSGLVKGVRAGRETITCSHQNSVSGVSGAVSCELEVLNRQVEEPEIPSVPSEITGPDKMSLTEGYADTEYSYSVTGDPAPQVTLEGDNTAGARLENGRVIVPAGLEAGEYTFTVAAENRGGRDSKTVQVSVSPRQLAPVIEGNSSVNLAEGYTDKVYRYRATGNPKPAVALESGTNTAQAVLLDGTVTIPAGLLPGSYSFTLTADSSAGKASKRVEVNVITEEFPPLIEGDGIISLREGYADTVYSYSVTGNPEPEVGLEAESNTAQAILTDGTVTVPAGLATGSYSFTLTAKNSAGEDSKTVQVEVAARLVPPSITGDNVINLTEGYSDAGYSYSAMGNPVPTLALEPDNNSARAVLADGVVTVPSGLPAGSYSFTLTAENSEGTDSKTVQVYVASRWYAPWINGKDLIFLTEGYSDLEYSYSVTGYPWPTVSLEPGNNTARAVLENGTVRVPAGLTPGNYTFTLTAKSGAGSASKTVTVWVEAEVIIGGPKIEGESVINLEEGYREAKYTYSVSGLPGISMEINEDNTAKADLSGNEFQLPWVVTVPEGLSKGSYSFTLMAENGQGKDSKTVQVNVFEKLVPPSITGENVIELAVGYEDTNYDYTVTGSPQPAVSLEPETNTAKAVLADKTVTVPKGLPAGSYSFTLIAENSKGKEPKTVQVNVNSLPTISGPAVIDLLYGYTGASYSYTVTGTPAPGLTLRCDNSNVEEFFSLTEYALNIQSGIHPSNSPCTVTLTAQNKAGSAQIVVTVNVHDNIILNEIRKNATAGEAFSWELSASGGAGGTYTYAMLDGNLPAGLSFSEDGKITGIPEDEPRSYFFEIQVTDCKGLSQSCYLTIELAPPQTTTTQEEFFPELQNSAMEVILGAAPEMGIEAIKPVKEPEEKEENPVKEPEEEKKDPAKEPEEEKKDSAKEPEEEKKDSAKEPEDKKEDPTKEPEEKKEDPAKEPENKKEDSGQTPVEKEKEPADQAPGPIPPA